MSYFGMYLLTILDNIGCMSAIVLFVSLILSVVTTIAAFAQSNDSCYRSDDSDKYDSELKKYFHRFKVKLWLSILLISITIVTFLPTTKQAAFIYIAPQIIENGAVKDTVKNIPELTKLGTDYLKELLKEKVEEKTK